MSLITTLRSLRNTAVAAQLPNEIKQIVRTSLTRSAETGGSFLELEMIGAWTERIRMKGGEFKGEFGIAHRYFPMIQSYAEIEGLTTQRLKQFYPGHGRDYAYHDRLVISW